MSRLCAITALLASAAAVANAGIVTLGAVQDNTLYESSIGDISNGAGEHCFAGKTAGSKIRRALVRFDVEGVLPPGASLAGSALTLHMSKTTGGPSQVSLHRVLQDWGEGDSDAQGEEGSGAPAQSGDATWVYNDYPTYYWSQQGGLYEANATESIEVGDVGDYTWGPGYGGGPALDVAMWLDGSAPNYGWVIVGDESASSTAKRFDTRENPVEAYRPMLTLYYQPACTADWDSNGSINTLDVLGFLNEWVAQVPSADLDHSGSVDILDVLIFLNAWSTGC